MNQYQQDHGNAPEQVKGRFLVFVIILILMFAYLFVGLVNLQLKSSEGYSTKTESTRLKTIPLTGKRGNITDANSVILATDEMVYNVTFYKDASESSSSVYKTYTQSIIDTLKIIERNGGKLAFSYVIQRSEETGEWEFNFGSGVSDATLQTRESQWRSNNYVTAKSYPTPEDCLVTLKHRYRMVNSAEEEEEVRAAYIEKRGDDSGYVPCIIVDEDTMLKVMAMKKGAATAKTYMVKMLDDFMKSMYGSYLIKSFGSDFKDNGDYYSLTGYMWLDGDIFSGDLTQPVRGCMEVRYYGPTGYALVATTIALEGRIRNYFDICSNMLTTLSYTAGWSTAPKPVPAQPAYSGDSGDYGTPYYWYDEDGDVWYWNGYENEFISYGSDGYIDDDTGEYMESNDAGWDYSDEYYDDYDPWSDPGDGWGDYTEDDGWGDYF